MIPVVRGKVTNQAHVDIPEGLCEEEYARNGFFGKYVHLYRSEPPVNWVNIDGPLKPHSYDLEMIPAEGDYVRSRKVGLYNDDVRIAMVKLSSPMKEFFRNADADELFFVHKGDGVIETDFGPLKYEKGDYIVIPRGTVYRWDVAARSEFLLVESMSEYQLPDKGMLGQHALFDPAVMTIPTPEPKKSEPGKTYELKILRSGEVTSVQYPFYPINTQGWKGTLFAWKINVRDIRPVISDRYHLPPSAHTTFVAHNFVVCSFLPRPLETGDDKAMRVPFYHSNIDFDEVLFYHDGEFFSRTGIKPGMMTFHPQGIHHGPQAGAVERSKKAERTNEVAVMIDTKRPLKVHENFRAAENADYWKSWMGGTK